MMSWLWGFVVDLINFFIDIFVAMFDFFVGLLPQTPFIFEPLEWGVFGNLIGTFIPVGTMATHFVLILTAIGLYYAVRWALRWLKMVR